MNEKGSHAVSSYHFSFLKDFSVHGFNISELNSCFSKYPFLMEPHRFDFHSFVFIKEGKGTLTIGGVSHEIKPGRLFLCPANTVHSFVFSEPLSGYSVFFCQDFYADEFSIVRLLYLFSFSLSIGNKAPVYFLDITKDDNSVLSLFDSLCKEYFTSPGRKSNVSHIIRSYLNILVLKISSLLNEKYEWVSAENNDIIIKLSHLIEANFLQHLNVDFYAKSLNLSKSKLNTICNKTLNRGLSKIILERRIMEIRRQLEQTDVSISEIAYQFHFSDNSYFTKVFKTFTRLTPKRYRELHRKMCRPS